MLKSSWCAHAETANPNSGTGYELEVIAMVVIGDLGDINAIGRRDDFKRYPKIRAYLVEHYTELEGSDGVLLIDTRRTLTGTFASLGFPCFR